MRTAPLIVIATAAVCLLVLSMKRDELPVSSSGDDAAHIARLLADLRLANEDRGRLGRELEASSAQIAELERDAAAASANAVKTPPAAIQPATVPPTVRSFRQAPKIALGPQIEPNDPNLRGKRYFAYEAYRGYRPYRDFKPFTKGEADSPGSAKFCQLDPLDSDCLGSVESCTKEPDVDECVGTQPYCERHPTARLCLGTEAFCGNAPTNDSCVGTAVWCLRHIGAAECRGARDDCERAPRQDQCLGTIAYCNAQLDRRLCPHDW